MQGEFLSELKGRITDVVIIPVPEGTRVNARFNGTLRGPKVNGTAKGTDYVLFRADGSGILHMHACNLCSEYGSIECAHARPRLLKKNLDCGNRCTVQFRARQSSEL